MNLRCFKFKSFIRNWKYGHITKHETTYDHRFYSEFSFKVEKAVPVCIETFWLYVCIWVLLLSRKHIDTMEKGMRLHTRHKTWTTPDWARYVSFQFSVNPCLVLKLGITKHQYFKEKCPWDNSKVFGKKDLFDPLILSEQTAFQILKIFLII